MESPRRRNGRKHSSIRTELGPGLPNVLRKNVSSMGTRRRRNARRIFLRSSMERSSGLSATRKRAPQWKPRRRRWKRFGSTFLLHLSSITCFATRPALNATSIEHLASSNAFSGCGSANQSCPNSKCSILCPEDRRGRGARKSVKRDVRRQKLQNELGLGPYIQ